MALTFAKKQILYAINKIMEMADVKYVDWYGDIGMTYSFGGITYEIREIHKPDVEEGKIIIRDVPSYCPFIKPRGFVMTTDSLGLKTYEDMFYAVLDKISDKLNFNSENKENILINLTEEYSLNTNNNGK